MKDKKGLIMYEIQEKIGTYDYFVIYESNDKEICFDLLDAFRKKHKYRLFRVIKVLK